MAQLEPVKRRGRCRPAAIPAPGSSLGSLAPTTEGWNCGEGRVKRDLPNSTADDFLSLSGRPVPAADADEVARAFIRGSATEEDEDEDNVENVAA